jgi:serine protease Do
MNSREHDKLTVQTVKQTSPSVVSIVISKYMPKTKSLDSNPLMSPFLFNKEEDGAKEKMKVGGGSGFVVHPSGLILTNKHVVFEEDAEYTVVTYDLHEYPAKVVSIDPINDIAILKVEAKGLPTIKLGDSTEIQLGQTVIAIGNALGMFSNSVSKGIISGLARSISASLGNGSHMEQLRGVIQTDVAINQGNSGGPLINLDGEAVAINTAVIYGAQNIGFSIPINWAKQDLEDIIKYGRIIKPYLGLMYTMLNKDFQKKYALSIDHGALVIRDHLPNSVAVVHDSPADKAGLKENDIITHINGIELASDMDLTDKIQEYKVGEEIELTVLRKEKPHNLTVKLEERKQA